MANDDDLDLFDDDGVSTEHTYLTFVVDAERYAVPVTCVTEIVRLPQAFALPDVPSYVRGVINLRGKVIPLLDVRGRFGMRDAAYTDRTVVVVVELDGCSTGFVVDAVTEVTEIVPEAIEPRRDIGHRSGPSMVSGVALRDNGVVFVLDVPTVLSGQNVTSMTMEHEAVRSSAGGRA